MGVGFHYAATWAGFSYGAFAIDTYAPTGTPSDDPPSEAGIEPSGGSVDDSYDNALAETIDGFYKAEVSHRHGPWRTFKTAEDATLD